MLKTKKKKNNKALFNTVEDDRIVWIYLILGFIAFLLIYLVYWLIKHDLPASEFVAHLTTFREYSVWVYSLLLLLIIQLFLLLRYKKKCRRIMQNGTSCIGKIVDSFEVPTTLKGHGSTTYWCQYKVKLPDGKIVSTERYSHDFMGYLDWRTCTVYEWNGEYYFTDFK